MSLMFIKYLTLGIISISTSLMLSSCGDDIEDICLECSENNRIDEFNDYYFRYRTDTKYHRVLHYDSTSGIESKFNLCFPDRFDSLESEKIIRANGYFHNPCPPDTLINVLISDYEIIDVCPNEVPNIAGEFDLLNEWTFHNITVNDSLIYLPCESFGSFINISTYSGMEDYDLLITGVAAENSFIVNAVVSADTLFLSQEFAITLSVGTRSEAEFERVYFQVLHANAKIKFDINDNLLNLKNLESNVELNLYTK